jgi:hypothetical protein
VIVAVLLVVTSGGPPERPGERAAPTRACSGSPDLCALRLNEGVFAGTHNSFSTADSPGWFIANQRHTIRRQLRDGIRLFLIDPHWGGGDEPAARTYRLRRRRQGPQSGRQGAPPKTLRAAQRLAGSVGLGRLRGRQRDLWLRHSVCELGATRMVDALEIFREYLEGQRREVVILFIEPYVPPWAIADVFERAGLDRYVASLPGDEPLPTLGELMRSNRRVIVFSEKDADGTMP